MYNMDACVCVVRMCVCSCLRVLFVCECAIHKDNSRSVCVPLLWVMCGVCVQRGLWGGTAAVRRCVWLWWLVIASIYPRAELDAACVLSNMGEVGFRFFFLQFCAHNTHVLRRRYHMCLLFLSVCAFARMLFFAYART